MSGRRQGLRVVGSPPQDAGATDLDDGKDAELEDAILAGARRHFEGILSSRQLQLMPPAPRWGSRWRLRYAVVAAAVVAAAALALAAVSLDGVLLEPGSEPTHSEALRVEAGNLVLHRSEVAESQSPRPRRRNDATTRTGTPAPDAAQPLPTVVAEEVPTPPAPRLRRAKPPSADGRLKAIRELDSAANQLWKAGDLKGAERKFRKIIVLAGRGSHAEFAYADLFTLARQAGDRGKQSRLWTQYLSQFPKGRFADDVRAGLCRRQADERATRCWREYVSAHPSGAHLVEAHAALTRTR